MRNRNCYFELVVELTYADAVYICETMPGVLVLGIWPRSKKSHLKSKDGTSLTIGVFDDTLISKMIRDCCSIRILNSRIRGVLDASWLYTLSLISSCNKRDVIAICESAQETEVADD